MEFVLFIIFGIFVGFCSGFFGIGGGAIIVTALMFFNFDIKEAIGISIMQMLFSSLYGSYLNYKKGVLRFGDSFFVGVGGLIGAAFSGYIVKEVSSSYLSYFFAFVLAVMIVRGLMQNPLTNKEIIPSRAAMIAIGALCGVAGVSVGIGGGMLVSLVFFGFLGYDIKKSVSMGLFFVVFAGISGFVSQSLAGLINYQLGALLGLGALVGVRFGVNAAIGIDRVKQKRINLLFNITMFCATMYKIVVIG